MSNKVSFRFHSAKSPFGVSSSVKSSKKLVIQPLKIKPTLPAQFESESWEKLQKAVRAIWNSERIDQSREELYQTVEAICIHRKGAQLYEKLGAELDALIHKSVVGVDSTRFLESVKDLWTQHCRKMLNVRNIFNYLDRSYVMRTPAASTIWEVGLNLLRSHLAQLRLNGRLIEDLVLLIRSERNGEERQLDLMYSCIRMIVALNLYQSDFEPQFLEETASYYEAEGQEYIQKTDVAGFLLHVEQRLVQENERIQNYLEQRSRKPLITNVESHLLAPHAESLLDRGLHTLMGQKRLEDLRRIYSLYLRIGRLSVLLQKFTDDIKEEGTKLLNVDSPGDLVARLLEYNDTLNDILQHAFESNKDFAFKLKTAWEHFLNLRETKPAELMAKFLDEKMRSQKGLSEKDVEVVLDKVMQIFRHLADKDVFEAFYKLGLSKRLLLRKSASYDLERSMIARLKGECGSAYTNKLEGMFKDIHLSDDFMAKYNDYLEKQSWGRHIETKVQVLTTGFWPTHPPQNVVLPPVLQAEADKFVAFYMKTFQGRRLAWQHGQGHCVVLANFEAGSKRLEMSQFQAMVCLCFNKQPELTFQEVQAETQIEEEELKRTLQSLTLGKQKILLKQKAGSKEITEDMGFRFNDAYTNPKTRIHINTIQLRETVAEANKTNEAVRRDRLHIIDAAVVRIMKTRNTYAHNLLVPDVVSQLKFPVTMNQVKARIESLIEREYMARDEEQPNVYNYLA